MSIRDNAGSTKQHQNRGVEEYPFDPLLRSDQVTGLDRLRCIADRKYAATLYDIYVLAERNEANAKQEREQDADETERAKRVRDRFYRLARRALAGDLGQDARDLAYLVVADDAGNVRDDGRALAELGRALAELGLV